MAAQLRQDAEGTQTRTRSVARMTATRMGGFFCALRLLVLASGRSALVEARRDQWWGGLAAEMGLVPLSFVIGPQDWEPVLS